MSKKQKQHQSIIPGHSIGTKVVNKDINFALRTWKRKVKYSNNLTSLKEKQEFIKPSFLNRQKMISARYRQKMKSLDEKY